MKTLKGGGSVWCGVWCRALCSTEGGMALLRNRGAIYSWTRISVTLQGPGALSATLSAMSFTMLCAVCYDFYNAICYVLCYLLCYILCYLLW